jgi:hypothetical protein
MTKSLLRISTLIVLAALACGLGSCGTVNGYLANSMGEYIPHWAGGLPPDAPPRPGTAKYDEFVKERERRRLEPAAPKEPAEKPSSSELDAVH